MEKFFKLIERIGNKLPHPFFLFAYLCGFILLLSLLASYFEWSAVSPKTGEVITAVNLLSAAGFRDFMTYMVKNFAHFAPLGLVLVMLMGISVSEKSGFLKTLIRSVVGRTPDIFVIPIIVIAAVCGNIGSSAGVVIVPPIAALIFKRMGKHPLAGLILGYAAATAGFTANLIPAGTDVLLSAITTEVYGAISPGSEIIATSNWYFMVAATFVLAIVFTFVVKKYTLPMCEADYAMKIDEEEITGTTRKNEKKALLISLMIGLGFLGLMSLTILPENGILRHPDPTKFMRSPFFKSLIPIFFFFFVIIGYTYGKIAGTIKSKNDIVHFMIEGIRNLAPYIVIILVISQFINFFKWSHLDQIIAIKGAEMLIAFNFSGIPLFITFIIMTALINLVIGSASAKWAMMAPIFVTMFYQLDISPALTQLLYRIGDSCTNGVSPLYTMFPLMLGWIEEYDENAGIGTAIGLLLPYSIFAFIAFVLLFIAWYFLGIPIGIGEPI